MGKNVSRKMRKFKLIKQQVFVQISMGCFELLILGGLDIYGTYFHEKTAKV